MQPTKRIQLKFCNLTAKKLSLKIKWIGKGLNEKAIDINSRKIIIDLDKKYLRPTEVDFLKGDFSKARKKLKWKPLISTNELIEDMIKEEISINFEMKNFFYPLIENPYRNKDINEAIKVLKTKKLTIGPKTDAFQKYFSKKLKTNFSIMVNSGSSANLLALQCLINPYRKKRLKPGDEVLIPSLCWSTSLWPIVQSGLKPKFVDIDLKSLNINLSDLKKKISKN